jgi:iron complex transport system ATP-binding protein
MNAVASAAGAVAGSVLRCAGVSLRAGARELVRDLTLEIHRGERWVVLGPNGAGKSTLLAALARVRPVAAGSIQAFGRPLAGWSVRALAERRALVVDRWVDPFAASVLDTVLTARYRLGAADRDGVAHARACLARMDCAELADHDVRTLSRGERQRAALATALAQDTPLLLLDEPTAHQDPRHQGWVLAQLAALTGRTIVAAMHDLNAAARFATHALLLSGRGHWTAGPAAEVLTAAQLSRLFDTRIESVRTDGATVFFVTDARDVA